MEQTLSRHATPTSPSLARLYALCARAGLNLDRVSPGILARMQLLAELTETLNDCERCADLAEVVFRHFDTVRPLERFTTLERRTIVIGTLFSDIGKTGPADADPEGQRLITEMFAVEGVLDGTVTVARFLEQYFPADFQERIARFQALGLTAQMTMREFWNMHSGWTLRILRGDGVPPEAVGAAATHHLLENVNPDAIVAEDGRLKRYLGENARFDRAEKLVILLDKYDAARRRGRRPHADAIAFLRGVIAKNPRFSCDESFFSLIDALDAAVGPSAAPAKAAGG